MSSLFKFCLYALVIVLMACNGFRPATVAWPEPSELAGKTSTIQITPMTDKPLATLAYDPKPAFSMVETPTLAATTQIVTDTPDIASPRKVITVENASLLSLLAELQFSPWDLVLAVAWSPDGEILAVAAGNSIYLYRTSDLQQLWSVDIGALTQSLAFSPDGNWLAAGSRDGYVRIWSVASSITSDQATARFMLQAHRKGVNSVAFSPVTSPIGSILASGGNDAIARFWSLDNGTELGYMVGGTFAIPSIAFLPDGSQLAVTNGDRIRLRQVGTERIAGTFASDEPLYSLAFSPDGGLLAVGGSDNQIRLWKPEQAFRTGQLEYIEPLILRGHSGRLDTYRSLVWQVVFDSSGELLASVGGDGSLRLWGIPNGDQLISLFAHPGGATCIAFRPDNTRLASGGLDGRLRIWGVSP